ncbi:MAG TPA: hypothetical protein PK122_02155 [Candidatus Paceibacterota bacterium]|nr:hypothetical protein [Candidatus Paceibacterota bacterium]
MAEEKALQAEKQVDSTQQVETKAYVPTYKIRPELKQAVLKAIGKYPFNQIASIMNAINVEVMDHNTLTNVINVLGNFPYQDVAPLLSNINDFIEQVVEE